MRHGAVSSKYIYVGGIDRVKDIEEVTSKRLSWRLSSTRQSYLKMRFQGSEQAGRIGPQGNPVDGPSGRPWNWYVKDLFGMTHEREENIVLRHVVNALHCSIVFGVASASFSKFADPLPKVDHLLMHLNTWAS